MLLNRDVCVHCVYLQGVLTLHISIVQDTWPAARPSGSMKVLSSPVTKSHVTPCENTQTSSGPSARSTIRRTGKRQATELSCLSKHQVQIKTQHSEHFILRPHTCTTRTSTHLYPHTQHQLPSGLRVESFTLFTLHVQLYSNPPHKLHHKIPW